MYTLKFLKKSCSSAWNMRSSPSSNLMKLLVRLCVLIWLMLTLYVIIKGTLENLLKPPTLLPISMRGYESIEEDKDTSIAYVMLSFNENMIFGIKELLGVSAGAVVLS